MKSVVIYYDTPSLCVKNCELSRKNCVININLGAAGVAGATYFLFCYIYTRAEVYNVDSSLCEIYHKAGAISNRSMR